MFRKRIRYSVRSIRGKYNDKWVVFRAHDNKVMTEGTIYHCMDWITEERKPKK